MLELVEVPRLHLACHDRAHRLVGVEHGDIATAPLPGQRGAAVDEHRGNVQPHHRHHHPGERLVAAREGHQRVVGVAARHRLDAVGDDLARHERVAHAVVAHRHRVCDRDRGEVEWHAARLAHRGAGLAGELAEQRVARRDAPVSRGDADERLGEIGVRNAERPEESAVRRAIQPFNRDARAQLPEYSHASAVILSVKYRGGGMLRALLSFLAIALAAPALSQPYPSRTVRIVVPFAVGGPADIYARFIGAKLQDALGQPFVIEDRPGGGSIVGTEAAAKSPPDGYTLLMMSNTHTVNETLIPKKPFDLMRDLAPISGVNYSDLLMVIHPSVPASNLEEFIALARSQPGKLNYASSGPGTPYHMAGELFKAMAGVDIVHIPHKGSDQARTAILGGQVQMMFDAITTMAAHARAGKVKALASSGKTRSPVTPDVPTVAQAGVPGYEATIWLGLMAPAGTPRAVLEKLNLAVNRIVDAPEVRETWAKQGAQPMGMSIDQFDKFLREDITKWAKVVRLSGAKVD